MPGAGFHPGGIEPLGESALFLEFPALAFKLAFQQLSGLVHRTEHGIRGEFRVCLGNKSRESGKAGKTDFPMHTGRQAGCDVVLEALTHGKSLLRVLVPNPQAVLDEIALEVFGEFIGETGSCDVGEFDLGFSGSGGGTAALADIAHSAARGLDHLVVSAERLSMKRLQKTTVASYTASATL